MSTESGAAQKVRGLVRTKPPFVFGIGLLLGSVWVSNVGAQQPYFGKPGYWGRNIEEKNILEDGKKGEDPPFKHSDSGCSENALLKGIADPMFATIDLKDKTCSYSDIKGLPYFMSWSYKCEASSKRIGTSSGQIQHRYNPLTETVIQHHTFFLDFSAKPVPGVLWKRLSGKQTVIAKRSKDCRIEEYSNPRGSVPRPSPRALGGPS